MESSKYRKLLLYTLFLIFIIGGLIIIIILSSIESPVQIRLFTKSTINYTLPQGWAFFTRDAREEKSILYAWNYNYQKLEKYNKPAFSFRHYAGFDRSVRKLMLEFGYLTSEKIGRASCRERV